MRSVIGALGYLWVRSARNRIASRLRRLRQPKYLIGGIVGLLYLWGFVFRNLIGGRWSVGGGGERLEPPPELWVALEVVGAWGLLLMMAGFWVVPSRRAALDFSEAEVQFLFPAPVSRLGLLNYKLASWQAGLLFTSLMVSLFSGRLLRGDGAWMSVLGWWMGLLLLQLHSLGASFVRTWLLERGVAHWQRRLAVALVLGGSVFGALAWGWREAPLPPEDFGDVESVAAWWVAVSGTTPMAQVLAPLRWVSRLALTREVGEFLGLAWPVLLLLGAHYLWVIRATVAFEEASVEAARAAVDEANRARTGRGAPRGGRGGVRAGLMFSLGPIGPSWVALGWKNLAGAGGWFRGRGLGVAVPTVLCLLLLGAVWVRGTAMAATIGSMALMLYGFSVLVGPSTARLDLRQDLGGSGWEVLKALPLTGRHTVMGALMAPWAVLTAIQWGLGICVVAYLPAPAALGEIGAVERGIVLAGLSLVGPAISLVGLCLQNGAALLFPAWVLATPGQGRGGFEVLGQRMIVYVAQMVVLVVALLPALLLGAMAQVAVGWFLGRWVGIGATSVIVAGVLLLESALAVRWLGWIWDRADLSKERAA